MGKINQDRIIVGNIFKNVYKAKRKCLLCEENSINSHLLQKNGILSNISSEGHIMQIKPKDFALDHKDGIIDISKIGINKGMSYFLFCNFHDTKVFEEIEQKTLDIAKYENQLLFSYRSLCAEYRKKEMNIDIFSRIINSSHFSIKKDVLEFAESQKEANETGNIDMNFYKTEFEKEIFEGGTHKRNFIFELLEFDFLPISASAVYTPINPATHTLEYLKNIENILSMIFINLIPINDKLYLLIGYHKDKLDLWIEEYIESWRNISYIELTEKLSDLVSTKIETWAISPIFYERINPVKLKKFKNYWNKHAMDLRITQKIDFNLFN